MHDVDIGFIFDEDDCIQQARELQEFNGAIVLPSEEEINNSILSPVEEEIKVVDDKQREVLIARILLLAAAALYGTNFTLVKILDETVPVGASTSLRFALAGLATLPWFLTPRSARQN